MKELVVLFITLFVVVTLVRKFVPYGDAVIAVVVAGVLLKALGVI